MLSSVNAEYLFQQKELRTISVFLRNEIINQTKFLPPQSPMRRRLWHIINNTETIPKCLNCSNNVKWDGRSQYRKYCSNKCSHQHGEPERKKKLTMIKRYGVEYSSHSLKIRQKMQQTLFNNYGVDNPSKSKQIKEKTRQTNLERYGVDNPSKHDDIKQKIRKTNLMLYGVEHNSQIEEVKNKKILSFRKRYGVNHPWLLDDIRQHNKDRMIELYGVDNPSQKHISQETLTKLNDKDWIVEQHVILQKSLSEIANELNVTNGCVRNYFLKHEIQVQWFFQSIGEKEINQFVVSLGIETITNVRNVIPPYELDIYIPQYNLAVEYCGLYWHSEINGKNKHYHKEKLDLCNDKGIRLLTIFEDEWLTKQDIVQSKIKSVINQDDREILYARRCTIMNVGKKQRKRFLEKYHIQGDGPSSLSYGLFHNNVLVALISFISKRSKVFILNRYATSCRVVGGFSKLLKHFQTHNEWNNIITFADLRWSNGNLYDTCGFTVDKILEPDYYYTDRYARYHKFAFRHKHLQNKLLSYDANLSEHQNCINNGLFRIWNCGLKRYII